MRLGFGPKDLDLGLETGIWASRMGFEGAGTDMEEKEKIPHMCESIGHRPLRGRCPKTEDGRILKKKIVIFMIFAPPHYPSKVKRYTKLLLCEAPKCEMIHLTITQKRQISVMQMIGAQFNHAENKFH